MTVVCTAQTPSNYCIGFYGFFLLISGRFSCVNLINPRVKKVEDLVETWGKVLVTAEYTDYGQHVANYCPKMVPKITCELSSVTSIATT